MLRLVSLGWGALALAQRCDHCLDCNFKPASSVLENGLCKGAAEQRTVHPNGIGHCIELLTDNSFLLTLQNNLGNNIKKQLLLLSHFLAKFFMDKGICANRDS